MKKYDGKIGFVSSISHESHYVFDGSAIIKLDSGEYISRKIIKIMHSFIPTKAIRYNNQIHLLNR